MSKKTTDEELDNEPEEEAALRISFKLTDTNVEPLPPDELTPRKKSGYNVFLGKCLPRKPSDVPTDEFLGICNRLWAEVPEKEKAVYCELANSPEPEEEDEPK